MSIPFLVCQFGKSTVSNLVKECFGSDFPDIFQKRQIDYIFRYLADLKARSVLLEFEYVDKDYLEDYSRFYVKRFSSLGHKCARLHFFACDLDHRSIDELLSGNTGGGLDLQSCYLGFMVVKPLPKTFIGKTCLSQYVGLNAATDRRALTRRYDVNLFGIDLHVDSIAFQEQDKVVSACATTSIWTSLHALNWRPVRSIPSCSEITTNAINFIEGSSNSFPNKELSNKQILRAMDVEGLRYHMESLQQLSRDEIFETVKCYIDSKLPIILGADVFAVNGKKALRKLAGHAVAVLGYKDGDKKSLYIHDDRLGPFARATFKALKEFSCPSELEQRWALVLQEKDDKGRWKAAHEVLVPNFLIAPTHQNVRLAPSFAINTCNTIVKVYERAIGQIVEATKQAKSSSLQNKLNFTVRLAEISELKRAVVCGMPVQDFVDIDGTKITISESEDKLLKRERARFLTGSYARFHWVAEFQYSGHHAFSLLIDATDIPQGDAVSAVLVSNKTAADAVLSILRVFASDPKALQAFEDYSHTFFGSFLRKLRSAESGYADHLNVKFGEPRAPRYLKEAEFSEGQIRTNASAQRLYEPVEDTLDAKFPQIGVGGGAEYLIWAIADDGALLIGEEIAGMGHPCLTGFKPARIAGELKRSATGWCINHKSGRYSGDYANAVELLTNALRRFQSIFHKSREAISIEPR